MEKTQRIPAVNPQAKDRFFSKVFETEESRRRLIAFLSGKNAGNVELADVRPVIFGNKENDLGILADHVVYYMVEAQSTPNLNMPYRLLEYVTAGLRGLIESEEMLYGATRVRLAVPKLYAVFVGVEDKKKMPKETEREMRLSDSYMECDVEPDLELTVHTYQFCMSHAEAYAYLAKNQIPERYGRYGNEELFWYALTANSLTYILKAERDSTLKKPEGVENAADVCRLLRERGIFRELFEDKEVCDMTIATFSREEMFRYAGRQEGMEIGQKKGMEIGQKKGMEIGQKKGMEIGWRKGREEGMERGIGLTKKVLKLEQQGCDVDAIAEQVGIDREKVIEILQ